MTINHRTAVVSLVTVCMAAICLSGCSKSGLVGERNPYYIKGIKYRQQSDYRNAVSAFEKCLRLSPESVEAHLQLGMLYEDHRRQPVKALYHYQKYLELRPDGKNAGVADEAVSRIEETLAADWAGLYGVGTSAEEIQASVETLQRSLNNLKSQKKFLLEKLRETNRKLVLAQATLHRQTGRRRKSALNGAEAGEANADRKLVRHSDSDHEEEVYVVKKGDTLISIARSLYGKGALWDELQKYNEESLGEREELKVGEKLNVPSVNELQGN
ncbi:MAG: LysM peptidoglycan-binding domain-containing protein [Lentisphaeria bacterium]